MRKCCPFSQSILCLRRHSHTNKLIFTFPPISLNKLLFIYANTRLIQELIGVNIIKLNLYFMLKLGVFVVVVVVFYSFIFKLSVKLSFRFHLCIYVMENTRRVNKVLCLIGQNYNLFVFIIILGEFMCFCLFVCFAIQIN